MPGVIRSMGPIGVCQEGLSQYGHRDVLHLGGAVFLYSSSYSRKRWRI